MPRGLPRGPVPERANHILIVIGSLGAGGAERVVVDLAAYLVELGRKVTVLTLNGDDSDAYALPEGVGRKRIEIRRPARWWIESLWFALSSLWSMRLQIRSINPDVTVSFIDQTNVRLLTASIGIGLPVIVSERVHPGHHPLQSHWEKMRRLTYRMADVVVVQTHEIETWFRANITTRRISVIHNAVRDNAGHRTTREMAIDDANHILAVGRLVPQKGFDQLISAFAKSGLAAMAWKLVILGEGQVRADLERQAQALGIADSVLLPGHVRDVAEWLGKASMFVLSSRFEGFPNVLLEAMQIGVPSISFDCPSGPSDIITNERNGLLVPGQDVDGLSAAILRLATDVDLQKRLSAEALLVNERFSRQKVYGQWAEVIDGAFRQHGASSGDAQYHDRRCEKGRI